MNPLGQLGSGSQNSDPCATLPHTMTAKQPTNLLSQKYETRITNINRITADVN